MSSSMFIKRIVFPVILVIIVLSALFMVRNNKSRFDPYFETGKILKLLEVPNLPPPKIQISETSKTLTASEKDSEREDMAVEIEKQQVLIGYTESKYIFLN